MINIKRKKRTSALAVAACIFLLALGSFGAHQAAAQSCPAAQEGLPADFIEFTRSVVPCGRDCDVATTEYDETVPCTLCHLVVMMHNIYTLMIAVLFIVALFFVTMGGVLLVVSSGNAGLRATARGVLVKTLVGFFLFLVTWLIVYWALVFISVDENQLGIVRQGGKWYEFTCSTVSDFGDETYVPGVPSTEQPTSEEERAARERLANAGISVWESSPGATEVGGLREETVQGVIDFRNQVGSDIIITGGSEQDPHASGIYSHGNGYKVDIEDTPVVNNYIESNYTYIGQRSDGAAMYDDGNGNIYARESTHWDVCYGCN